MSLQWKVRILGLIGQSLIEHGCVNVQRHGAHREPEEQGKTSRGWPSESPGEKVWNGEKSAATENLNKLNNEHL